MGRTDPGRHEPSLHAGATPGAGPLRVALYVAVIAFGLLSGAVAGLAGALYFGLINFSC